MTRLSTLTVALLLHVATRLLPVWAAEIDPLVMDNLAVISAGNGAASGFIASINNTNYLVTNEHVLRAGLPFRAELLNGSAVQHDKTIHMSRDSDVVLIKTRDQSRPALKPFQGELTIGALIDVVGNAGGHGVATHISGTIVGVGPHKLEIDAKILPGNSGSPVLLSDGTVAGVATYVVGDISGENGPEARKEFRRFAFRLDGLNLVPVDAALYFKVAGGLSDLDTFCGELKTIITTSIKGAGYSLEVSRKKYKSAPRLAELLDAYSVALKNVYEIEHAFADLASRYGNDLNRVPQSVLDNMMASLHFRSIQDYRDELTKAYANLMREPAKWIEGNMWPTSTMNSEALQYRDYIQSVMAILPGKDGYARIK